MYVTFYIVCLYVMLLTTVEGAGKDRIMHNSERRPCPRSNYNDQHPPAQRPKCSRRVSVKNNTPTTETRQIAIERRRDTP